MIQLLRREFVVPVSVEAAWEHLAQVSEWPSWAAHIKRVKMSAGPLGPNSSGSFHLSNGIRSTFRMSEFHPPRSWKWVGPFLWLQVHYDHRFEPIDNDHTRMVWILEAQGFGVSLLGRLFAKIYNRNLDRAVPRLIAELASPS